MGPPTGQQSADGNFTPVDEPVRERRDGPDGPILLQKAFGGYRRIVISVVAKRPFARSSDDGVQLFYCFNLEEAVPGDH
jgi:hypothetical protein